jgi:transposase
MSVKYHVMDMNASYAQLIQLVFPNAQIITDRFHIDQHINRSFNQLRVKIMTSFRKSDTSDQKKYRSLKRFWKLLLMDSTRLDEVSRDLTSLYLNDHYTKPIL